MVRMEGVMKHKSVKITAKCYNPSSKFKSEMLKYAKSNKMVVTRST